MMKAVCGAGLVSAADLKSAKVVQHGGLFESLSHPRMLRDKTYLIRHSFSKIEQKESIYTYLEESG